ncbi:MAG: hypothetical protein ABIJ82_02200 [Patescibacteria group bacterium]
MAKRNLFAQVNILPLILIFLVTATSKPNSPDNKSGLDSERTVKTAEARLIDAQIKKSREKRIEALEKFFTKLKSPLKANAATFVDVADKYNLDYRLLPAISCMESTCGKFLIEGSYNPFGWGIYGKNAIYFKSYDEAIDTVAKGIRDNYTSKGLNTPEKIAPVYTPPNYVNWRNGVNYFISRIDACKSGGTGVSFLG